MGKIPNELKATIAQNIRDSRMKKFPGRGGGKKCAEAFGVSPQQWSPWERGMRTPDELRLQQIADFFGVTVEFLRRSHTAKPEQETGISYGVQPPGIGVAPTLREPEAPPFGLPSLRKEESPMSLSSIGELSHVSARLLEMICSTARGVTEGKLDAGKSIIVLRRLGDILDQKLKEADNFHAQGNFPRLY